MEISKNHHFLKFFFFNKLNFEKIWFQKREAEEAAEKEKQRRTRNYEDVEWDEQEPASSAKNDGNLSDDFMWFRDKASKFRLKSAFRETKSELNFALFIEWAKCNSVLLC